MEVAAKKESNNLVIFLIGETGRIHGSLYQKRHRQGVGRLQKRGYNLRLVGAYVYGQHGNRCAYLQIQAA